MLLSAGLRLVAAAARCWAMVALGSRAGAAHAGSVAARNGAAAARGRAAPAHGRATAACGCTQHGHLDEQGEGFSPVQKLLQQDYSLKPRHTLPVEIQQLGGVSSGGCRSFHYSVEGCQELAGTPSSEAKCLYSVSC